MAEISSEKLRSLTETAITLAETEEHGVVASRRTATIERRDDGSVIVDDDVREPRASSGVFRLSWKNPERLEGLATFVEAARDLPGFLATFDKFTSPKAKGSVELIVGLHLISKFAGMVCKSDQYAIDEAKWTRHLPIFRTLLHENRVKYFLRLGLSGVEVQSPLGDEVVLRPVRDAELAELHVGMLLDFMKVNAVASIVEVTYDSDAQHDPESRERALASAQAMVTALRLWETHDIKVLYREHQSNISETMSSSPVFHGLVGSSSKPLSNPEGFAAFFTRVRGALTNPPKKLGLALRRFELMHDQPRVTERILDEAIILEALLGDGQGELTFKLSTRAPLLALDDPLEREEFRTVVRDGYAVRSAIAHGGRKTSERQLAAVPKFAQLARLALRRYIELVAEHGKPFSDNAVADLDSQALGIDWPWAL